MSDVWAVTDTDIKGIKDTSKLHTLLQCLLECELARNQIPIRSASVSLNVNRKDGGEDALVKWNGDPPDTDRIPLRRSLFQVKGGNFPFSDFKNEPFIVKREKINGKTVTKKTLKTRVDENLSAGGGYVFFCSGVSLAPTDKEKAAKEIKAALGQRAKKIPILVYDSGEIASWVNRYAAAKVMVLGWLGKADLATYMTWDEWSAFPRPIPDPPWVANPQMEDLIAQIKTRYREPRQIMRLLGQSGLGKSRTLLEAFRPPSDPELDTPQAILSGSLVYIIESEGEKLLSSIAPLVTSSVAGTIIVDDCKEKTHLELARWIGRSDSQLSLITIDYQIEEDRTHNTIQLFSSDKTLIEAILRTAGFMDPDLAVLTEYCDGFPAIAALLASLPPEDRNDFYQLTPSQITQRLVWGRSAEPYDQTSYDVLATCALFAQVGIQNPYGKHLQYVADLCRPAQPIFTSD